MMSSVLLTGVCGFVGANFVNEKQRHFERMVILDNMLDDIWPMGFGIYADQVRFVANRLGHDFRYHIDTTKITRELGWAPKYDLEFGLFQTVQRYVNEVDSSISQA